jgi:glyoxylase-like metal-dependent hydrolase (beta-lactamase superfamily II)
MPDLPVYDLFAIRYATRAGKRSDHFIGGDPHDGPMPMDYFVWAAVSPAGAYVIDTGFTGETAARRGRTFLRCAVDSLCLIGVDPDAVENVILTHMHYDHVGNFHRFPRARFHLQEPELRYATGRLMCHARLRHSFEVEDVVGIVRLNYAGRVEFYNGPAELAPGIAVHPAPGHSLGLQFVRVHTRRGWVVIASDVTHFYENMESGRPFATAVNVGGMLDGFDALAAHAPAKDHIVPGHDPLVMARYPAVSPELAGIAVRLDVEPQLATDTVRATRTKGETQ